MHLHDARLNLKYMDWHRRRDFHVIESDLIFHYHKIEKGLCMPPPKRFFGAEAVRKTIALLREWENANGNPNSPAYLGAIAALQSYEKSLANTPPPQDIANWLNPLLAEALKLRSAEQLYWQTPIPVHTVPEGTAVVFEELMKSRRSVRHYLNQPISLSIIEQCIATAQLSPSACNRQPWRVHVYTQAQQIRQLLSLQNGNAGFGHELNTLLAITADRKSFFGTTERHEPYVDGGLFAMSLLLALQSHGISTCCLNWCVASGNDRKAHEVGHISENEAIIMFLAIGYADRDALVPRSARKLTMSAMQLH
jgi:nitroreductase